MLLSQASAARGQSPRTGPGAVPGPTTSGLKQSSVARATSDDVVNTVVNPSHLLPGTGYEGLHPAALVGLQRSDPRQRGADQASGAMLYVVFKPRFYMYRHCVCTCVHCWIFFLVTGRTPHDKTGATLFTSSAKPSVTKENEVVMAPFPMAIRLPREALSTWASIIPAPEQTGKSKKQSKPQPVGDGAVPDSMHGTEGDRSGVNSTIWSPESRPRVVVTLAEGMASANVTGNAPSALASPPKDGSQLGESRCALCS